MVREVYVAQAPGVRAPLTARLLLTRIYVQYHIALKSDRHVPVVMVHGCCLSSKTCETTPDGRIGCSEYFAGKGRMSVWTAGRSITRRGTCRAGKEPRESATDIHAAHAVSINMSR
jgi:hypothetical protein